MSKKMYLYLSVLICILIISISTSYALLDMSEKSTSENSEVSINQHLYERIDTSKNDVKSTNLKEYVFDNESSVNKFIYPAVYFEEDPEMTVSADDYGNELPIWSGSVKNVVDNFIYVENKSNEPVSIKTYFAFEKGSLTKEEFEKYIKLNLNSKDWTYTIYDSNYLFEDNYYYILVANPVNDTKLAKDEISKPSLLQVLFDKTVTNEVIEKIDKDKDGKYEIIVRTIASQ